MTTNNSSNLELYLRILDQFPNPIWRAGTDAKCNFFNKAWLNFTGRTMEQEMGDGWAEGVYADDLQRCLKIYTESFKAKKSFKMDYRLKHRDGTYHWIADYGSPFFNDDRVFLGYIGSCYDINEEKNHLAEIEKLNKFMTGREIQMATLKKQIEELQVALTKK